MKEKEWKELDNPEELENMWAEIEEDFYSRRGEPRLPNDVDIAQYATKFNINKRNAGRIFEDWRNRGHPKFDVVWAYDEEKKRSLWVIRLKS